MKVLITGIAGFVGSHLTDFLIQKRQEIYGTCLGCEPLDNIAHIKKRVKITECDVTDFNSLKKLINRINPDRIYHLAGFSSVGQSFNSPLDAIEVNVRGTLYILEILRKIKKRTRLLVVSSSDVYGRVKTKDLPIKETHPLKPVSPYGSSKACADLLAFQYYQSYGIPVIRTRSFNHTGPRQRLEFVIPDFASQIAKIDQGVSKAIMKVGNLSAERDISDVRDVVRAYYLLMEKGKPGEAYNVCSGRAYRIETLLKTLLGFSTKEIKVKKMVKARPVEIPVLLGDNTKIEKELGWKPRISIHKTLEDTLDYWKDMYSRG